MAGAALVPDAHEHASSNFAVELKRPAKAIRHTQSRRRKCVDIRGWSVDDRRSVAGIVGYCLRGIPLEHRNIEWNLVVEEPYAAADRSLSIVCGSKDEADTRTDIDCLRGKAVVVQPQAEIECEPREDLPVVLHEQSEVI